MSKGLLVSIYTNGCNSSNGGLSSKHTKAILTGPGIAEIFTPNDEAPEIQLMTGNLGYGYRAVPAEHGKGIGPMFGGCFVYTSDSRFPSEQPIPLHDRWESQELNDALSR